MGAVADSIAALEAQTEAEARAKQAAADAAEALEAQKKAEAALKKAENELKAAVEALEAEQKAFDDKKADLEAKSELGGVKGMRAKNELAQMLSEDPLPLRRAKITQGAALKRAQKARKPFAEATAKGECPMHIPVQFTQESPAGLSSFYRTAYTQPRPTSLRPRRLWRRLLPPSRRPSARSHYCGEVA